MIENLVTILHILTCITLILVIILQSGKGGGVSAAFGGGAGAALGQRSAATVLGKFTAVAAGIFMVTSMVLAVFSTPSARDRTLKDIPAVEQTKAPALRRLLRLLMHLPRPPMHPPRLLMRLQRPLTHLRRHADAPANGAAVPAKEPAKPESGTPPGQ